MHFVDYVANVIYAHTVLDSILVTTHNTRMQHMFVHELYGLQTRHTYRSFHYKKLASLATHNFC